MHWRPASWNNRNGLSQKTLDRAELLRIFAGHKTRGTAGRFHPSRTPDPMHVVFGNVRQVEIDHVTDVGNINPTGRNIRRHQDPKGSSSKTFQRGTSL